MELQTYFREQLAGKSVILVGNATFERNRSAFIDGSDIVIRFNHFTADTRFDEGLCGRKTDVWINNLRTNDEEHRKAHYTLAKQLNRHVVVGTPHYKGFEGVAAAQAMYQKWGAELVVAEKPIELPKLSKQPTVGFYTAARFLAANLPITVIGFTGEVSHHHKGDEEIDYLKAHDLVDFIKHF